MNEFYHAIQQRKGLKDKLKMIGIGVGNTPSDVEYFKKKYEVPFPLFPDPDQSVHKALGKPKAPYFIGVKINDDGSSQVFYSKRGGFKKADDFLALMLRLSGLQ